MLAGPAMLFLMAADELYRTGVALLDKGEPAKAAAVLQKAAEAAPRNALVWKALGVAHAAQGNYGEAEPPFGTACKLDQQLEDACYFHARALYALNQFEASIAVLEKIKTPDRRPWRIPLGIAQASEALGLRGQAHAEFQRAMRLYEGSGKGFRGRPDDDPRLHYGIFLFRQGNTREALPRLEASARDFPASARAAFELGRALYQAERLEEAEKHLRRSVELGHGSTAEMLLAKTRQRLRVR